MENRFPQGYNKIEPFSVSKMKQQFGRGGYAKAGEMLLASAQNACALVASAIPYLTAGECAAGLVGSGFNFGLFELTD